MAILFSLTNNSFSPFFICPHPDFFPAGGGGGRLDFMRLRASLILPHPTPLQGPNLDKVPWAKQEQFPHVLQSLEHVKFLEPGDRFLLSLS